MSIGKLGWTKKSDSRKKEADNTKERLKIALVKLKELRKLTIVEYLKLLDEAYRAHDTHKREKAIEGTKRHEALESYVKMCLGTNGGVPLTAKFENPFVQKFADYSVENIKKFLWSEIHCYNLELWVGGIADVGWIDMDDEVVAGDFKSSKEAYFSQFIQIAGYDEEISDSGGLTANGEKIFKLPKPISKYCVIPFGADEFQPKFVKAVEEYRDGFRHALSLYRLSESYGD